MKLPGITLRPIEIMTSPNQVHFVQCFTMMCAFRSVMWSARSTTVGMLQCRRWASSAALLQVRDQIRYAYLVEKMIAEAGDVWAAIVRSQMMRLARVWRSFGLTWLRRAQ